MSEQLDPADAMRMFREFVHMSLDDQMITLTRWMLNDQAVLETALTRYDRLNTEFASCGMCRQRMYIELNSRCDEHREKDEESW